MRNEERPRAALCSAAQRRPASFVIRVPLLVVVLAPKMGYELFTLEISQRVLEFHELDEQVVLGIETRGMNRTLEVEREPFLDAMHPGTFGEIEKQRDVQHDRRRQNAVAAEKIDLELHRVAEPTDE